MRAAHLVKVTYGMWYYCNRKPCLVKAGYLDQTDVNLGAKTLVIRMIK